MRVKFWQGWITSEKMTNPGWFEVWKNAAEEAEKENCELVVFKIPKKGGFMADPQTVEDVERYLQSKFPNYESKNV